MDGSWKNNPPKAGCHYVSEFNWILKKSDKANLELNLKFIMQIEINL